MGRLEAFAMQNGPWESFLYGVGNGLGYAKILVIVAFFRELLGSGTLLGFNILNYEPLQKLGYVNNGLMLMPPMALILCACIIWYQRARHKELQSSPFFILSFFILHLFITAFPAILCDVHADTR